METPNGNDPTFDFKAAYIRLAGRVQAMRRAQKNYFSTRSQKALLTAKEIEIEVDQMLNPQPPKPSQPSQGTIDWLGL